MEFRYFGQNVAGNLCRWLMWSLQLQWKKFIERQPCVSIQIRCNRGVQLLNKSISLRKCLIFLRYSFISVTFITKFTCKNLIGHHDRHDNCNSFFCAHSTSTWKLMIHTKLICSYYLSKFTSVVFPVDLHMQNSCMSCFWCTCWIPLEYLPATAPQ